MVNGGPTSIWGHPPPLLEGRAKDVGGFGADAISPAREADLPRESTQRVTWIHRKRVMGAWEVGNLILGQKVRTWIWYNMI